MTNTTDTTDEVRTEVISAEVAATHVEPALEDEETVEYVIDLPEFFLCSGMADAVRDFSNTALLSKASIDSTTTSMLRDQYAAARTQLFAVVDESVHDKTEIWAPALDDDASASDVAAASFTMARWMDLLMGSKRWLAAEYVRDTNDSLSITEAEQRNRQAATAGTPIRTQIAAAMANRQPQHGAATVGTTVGELSTGQYL